MNVAIITHRFVKGDGQGRVNYEVVRHAASRGHRLALLASEADPALCAHPNVQWVPMPVAGWPTTLVRDQVFAWRTARWLQRHREAFDVVVANGFITWAGAAVNAVHHVHSISRRQPHHASRVRSGPYGWYHWLYSALNAVWEKQAFQKAEALVAVSEKVRDELVEIGMPAEAVRVIHNGVDTEEFVPGDENRAALGLPGEGTPLALFVGDIRTPGKNLDTVLNALQRVPALHLAVAGSTEKSPYPQMASDLGVAERTRFLGFRRDVPALMRAADLFAFPSRYEACSLVMMEAMASGLPVVTARTAGGAELVSEAGGVVLPDPNDVERLADALGALVGDAARLKRMSQQARTLAEAYTWERMAEAYVHLFEDVAPRVASSDSVPTAPFSANGAPLSPTS